MVKKLTPNKEIGAVSAKDIENAMKYLDSFTDVQVCTECISCGASIPLGYGDSINVRRMCNECKEAIKFAKEFMSDAVHETAKQFRQDSSC